MAKFRVLTEAPPMARGDAENQLMELRDYLTRLTEELEFLLTHLEADNIDDTTFQRIQQMIPDAYTGLPPMDGEASGGSANAWARGDHRHPTDSSRAAAADLSAHVGDTANPHGVTKAQVGLGNVDNVQQYSASNPPPIPTPAEVGAIPTTEKGSANGVAELDANGMVPSAQLPSYVDDVLEYASQSAFPATGESGKIYVALDTGRTYRWSGSAYVEISESLALGETSSTAYRGDRGKTAYDHSQINSGNPHNVTAAEVGARPDTWTPSASDVGAQPTITASGMLKGDGLGGVSAATAGTDYQAPLTAGVDYQTPLAAGTDYQTPLVAGTDYATPAMIPTVPDPSDATPQDLGTAAAGVSDDYSRADHVHDMPGAGDIDYDNTGSGLSATDVQAAIDEVAQGGGGGGPSPATATPVMDGTGAVGVSLLYAREDHEHPSDTAKQDAITASGMLKGDGLGGVSAATAGTDYQAPLTAGTDYATPGMIPSVPAISTSTPNMDGTAAAGSTGEVSDAGHTHPSDTSRVPVYGMGENLLDNADFANPVNQRGQSSYTGANTYGISRWKTTPSSGSKVQVSNGAVTVSETGSSYGGMLQIVSKELLLGKTVTLSIVYKRKSGGVFNFSLRQGATNNIGSALGTVTAMSGNVDEVNLAKVTVTVPSTITASNNVFFAVHAPNAAASMDVIAAKMELGTEQTLAHLEGSTWVLNEIPDYEQELIRCQTSTADSTDTYANKTLATEQQIAYVETGTTASNPNGYKVGEYFCWGGLLYRVKLAIQSGEPFTVGTNCEQVTVNSGLIKQYPFTGTTSSNYGGISGILPSGLGDIVSIKVTKVNASSGLNTYAIPFVGTDGKLSGALFYNLVTGSLKSVSIEGVALYV